MSSYGIMTNVGRNKEAAALANSTPLSITEIAWGDGERSPGGGETALLNEQGRKAVQGTGLVQGNQNSAYFEVQLTAAEGPFTIREAGLFDADGDMIAIVQYDPPVNKPQGSVAALLRINIVFSDLQNLNLNIQGIDAYAPADRAINAGAGLSGGGDLAADRTISVDFATTAEVLAGTVENKSVTPKTLNEKFTGSGGVLRGSNNLSEITDQAQARANLGVGSGGVPDVLVRGEGAPDMGSVQLTPGVFNTMRLTNLALNGVSAGLSANQISLPAGSYYAKFVAPINIKKSDSVGGLGCRLFNVTDNLTATPGQTANGGDWQTINLTGAGTFTLADTKTLEVQVFASESNVWEGDGWPGGGETQICTILEIWQIPT